MSYYITNQGEYYGKKNVWGDDKSRAIAFTSATAASNLIKSNHLLDSFPNLKVVNDQGLELNIADGEFKELTEQDLIIVDDNLTRIFDLLEECYDLIPAYVDYVDQKVKEYNLRECDMLHEIEFSSPNYLADRRMFKNLRDMRRERRRYKDLATLLANSNIASTANFAHKVHEAQRTRTYTKRVKEVVDDAVDKAQQRAID